MATSTVVGNGDEEGGEGAAEVGWPSLVGVGISAVAASLLFPRFFVAPSPSTVRPPLPPPPPPSVVNRLSSASSEFML